MTSASIGVFDSGLGGLTVARAIGAAVPGESLVYLGDTARVPYGTRSPRTVVRYALRCGRELAQHNIKFLVVACNTVSAVALDALRLELDIPVLGVIRPGARAGAEATHTGRCGVLATAGTVASGAYSRAMAAENSRVEVIARPAPLLVPLAEEGWTDGEVPRLAVRRYLAPLVERDIDTLVLGCTHYPLFRDILAEEFAALSGRDHPVVDSAAATASELESILDDRELRADESSEATDMKLLVTDMPDRFADVASRFLGRDVESLSVSQVDL